MEDLDASPSSISESEILPRMKRSRKRAVAHKETRDGGQEKAAREAYVFPVSPIRPQGNPYVSDELAKMFWDGAERNRRGLCHAGFSGNFIYFLMGTLPAACPFLFSCFFLRLFFTLFNSAARLASATAAAAGSARAAAPGLPVFPNAFSCKKSHQAHGQSRCNRP